MTISGERLREIVAELSGRPGHEKVRTLVYTLLVEALGADSGAIDFERPLPEVRGRVDALLGNTVFEFKRNLRVERAAAEDELARYLPDRERETGVPFIGVATDGAEFVAYQMRDGRLATLRSFVTPKDDPRTLLVWLDSVVTVQPDLVPDPETVTAHLGRGSVAYGIARMRLADAWEEVKNHPDVRLKRQLWADLLEHVYGSEVDDDELFYQHTYLTIVAKAMATLALGVPLPEPADLLSGRPFSDIGLRGAVESDFFDWVLESAEASQLITRIGRQVARFRLTEVRTDVLKGLYESLVDPRQRHDLGEYYTPDWLAARICERAIERPLDQRVLDPACGSGTFLFHAVRRFLAAADAARLSNDEALARCCDRVLGIDIHPVAVLIARVTYLLALGNRLGGPRGTVSIPVYLGDSLQWNTRGFLAERDVLIEVPDGPLLEFPGPVAREPALFDAVIQTMLDLSERGASLEEFAASLPPSPPAGPLDERSRDVLVQTYEAIRALNRDGRDHVWGYVARNLSRPVWLSSNGQRVDVVVGNPPWLSYRYMSPAMQERFREECQHRGVWAGGKVATHQDLSAYFFARCVELYLRDDGTIAFVMPYAALNRKQFEGFRRGLFGRLREKVFATVRFTDAWAFDERVQPLFPVPSCVLFAQRGDVGPLPTRILAATGTLPRRDATPEEAGAALEWREVPWPGAPALDAGSPYRGAFRQGATMVPRMLCTVALAPAGKLGMDQYVPLVESRRAPQEKEPWKSLPPLRSPVEREFLRPLYLGESVAPFRLLEPVLAVVPWHETTGRLLDAKAALGAGYRYLSRWLEQAERLWREHGRSAMSLVEQLDYYGKLSAQFPPAPVRVLYAASGTLPAAAVLRNGPAIVEHSLYWAPATEDEALYLVAILNSESARARIEKLQARGQWGARHFDKLMFELPIPRFDPGDARHRELAGAAREAEEVAARVALPEGMHFVRARQRIRDALRERSIARRIEALVGELLG